MKKTINIILYAVFIIFSSSFVGAQSLSPELTQLANESMYNIFQKVVGEKERYRSLSDFDKSALFQNEFGVYLIEFQNEAAQGLKPGEKLEFGLTVVPIESKNPFQKSVAFDEPMPLLGLKFVGYQNESLRQRRFEIKEMIKLGAKALLEKEQEKLPFLLSISTDKNDFEVGEPVEFSVTLKNVSSANMKVKDLNKESIFFLYDGRPWGAHEIDPENNRFNNVILEAGESLVRRFQARGFRVPKSVDIIATYAMTYEGINPTARATFEVLPEPSK